MNTLLIVDDDPGAHLVYCTMLKNLPLHFESAYSGAEGIEKIKALNPALTLLDLIMPDMSGIEVLKHFDCEGNPLIQSLVCSAMSDKDSILTALSLGASDYLIKPVDPKKLESAVRDCIQIEPPASFALPLQPVTGADAKTENPSHAAVIEKKTLSQAMAAMVFGRVTGQIIVVFATERATLDYTHGKLQRVAHAGKTGIDALEVLHAAKPVKIYIQSAA